MRTIEKDQIGFKELFAIIFLTLGTKSSDMSTIFLFKNGLNAAWMIVLGSFLLIIPSLLLLNSVLKKYKSKDLLEITQLTLGKPIAFIIALFMMCFFTFNTASDVRSYLTQLITINFPNTSLFIMLFFFLVICMWGAKKGWESIGSIAWMVLPYILLTIGFLYFLIIKDAIFLRIFPLFGSGKWAVAKASFEFTSLYPEPFILSMMYPFVKSHKIYTRGLYSSLLFTVFIMVTMYLAYVWLFDYRSLIKITFPFNEVIRVVSIGKTITNIEPFFITIWLIGAFVKFIVYIYFLCKIFGYLFSIEEYENTIIPIGLLILIMAMIPESNEVNVFIIRQHTGIYVKYLLLFLPPLLWIVSKIKEVRKN